MMMVMAWTTALVSMGHHHWISLVSIASGCGVTIGILESSLTFVASKPRSMACKQVTLVSTAKVAAARGRPDGSAAELGTLWIPKLPARFGCTAQETSI